MGLGAIQWRTEATPGTYRASTAILENFGSAEWGDELVIDQPEFLDGTYALHSNGTMLGRTGRLHLGNGLLDFEQLPAFLASGIKTISGVTDAGSPPAFTYTAVPTLTSQDTNNTLAIEAKNDSLVEQLTYGVVESFKVGVAGPRAHTDCEVDLFGQLWATSTLTPSLAHVATELVPGSAWGLKLDDTGGTIGTTAYAGCLKSFSFDSGKLWTPYDCLANTTIFTGIQRPRMAPSLTIRVAVDAALAAAMVDWRAGTRQLIQLYAEGTVIHGAVKKSVTIQMAGRITAMSRVGASMDQEQWTREITFVGERDTTWGSLFRIVVVNAEAALRGA